MARDVIDPHQDVVAEAVAADTVLVDAPTDQETDMVIVVVDEESSHNVSVKLVVNDAVESDVVENGWKRNGTRIWKNRN